ncbi:MAG TPA: glycosyltransferase family 2 protein [Gemmatimonas sp.]|nr:glycosyltransferase family 2 protein [Gemmatimonas sp.]
MTCRLFVVVPFYQEERMLPATLRALEQQRDSNFEVVLVDNGSTDGSRAIAIRFQSAAPFRVHLVDEAQKGTGAAADTGFRAAIALGADVVARTDADCVPDPWWTTAVRTAFDRDGLDFAAGRIRPRTDEGLTLRERFVLPAMVALAERYGRYARRGPQFRYPYFMAAGNNLAITAGLYERAGGFPRTAIEHVHEDRALSEAVRQMTDRAAVRDDMIVYNSVRRVRAYGFVNVLRWYRNHGYRPLVVDVR